MASLERRGSRRMDDCALVGWKRASLADGPMTAKNRLEQWMIDSITSPDNAFVSGTMVNVEKICKFDLRGLFNPLINALGWNSITQLYAACLNYLFKEKKTLYIIILLVISNTIVVFFTCENLHRKLDSKQKMVKEAQQANNNRAGSGCLKWPPICIERNSLVQDDNFSKGARIEPRSKDRKNHNSYFIL